MEKIFELIPSCLQILDRTKLIVLESIGPAFRTFKELKEGTEEYVSVIKIRTLYKVHYLRSYSWRQADRVMSTEAGVTILKTLDETAELAELLLDKYLPALDEEELEDYSESGKKDLGQLSDRRMITRLYFQRMSVQNATIYTTL